MPVLPNTDMGLKALKPDDRSQTDYFDTKAQGLLLRVNYGGSMAWYVRYNIKRGGKWFKRRQKIGRYPIMGLSAARIEAQAILNLVEDGEDPAKDKRQRGTAKTVKDLAKVYVKAKEKAGKRSWKKDEAMLDNDVIPVIGDRLPDEVTPEEVGSILDRLIERGADIQANRVFEVVRGFFNWASPKYLKISPCLGMKKPTKERARQRALTHEEIRALWNMIKGRKIEDEKGKEVSITETVSLALLLLMLTGQRASEVTQAPISEFDLEGNVWIIPGERTKNGRLHRVPLAQDAKALIEKAIKKADSGEWLFPGWPGRKTKKRGERPISTTAINHGLRRLLMHSKLDDIRPHDFRSIISTELEALNVPEAHRSALLNHIKQGVTGRHYSHHAYEAEKRKALEIWEGRLQGIIAGQAGKVVSMEIGYV